MKTKTDNKTRAKQIIVEIIRRAGGTFTNKTNLYKAFYYAHLRFADTQPGYLSAWPIVRMPRGPGIDRFDVLLGELMADGKVETKQIRCGDYNGFRFTLCGPAAQDSTELPPEAVEAISFAVNRIDGKSANQVSDLSHVDSRAWREAQDGEELNIYLDSLGDDEYRAYATQAEDIAGRIDAVLDGS